MTSELWSNASCCCLGDPLQSHQEVAAQRAKKVDDLRTAMTTVEEENRRLEAQVKANEKEMDSQVRVLGGMGCASHQGEVLVEVMAPHEWTALTGGGVAGLPTLLQVESIKQLQEALELANQEKRRWGRGGEGGSGKVGRRW